MEEAMTKWRRHAEYWLSEYKKPLHILLYNAARQNTSKEIEDMQRFFGYNFDGANFR